MKKRIAATPDPHGCCGRLKSDVHQWATLEGRRPRPTTSSNNVLPDATAARIGGTLS